MINNNKIKGNMPGKSFKVSFTYSVSFDKTFDIYCFTYWVCIIFFLQMGGNILQSIFLPFYICTPPPPPTPPTRINKLTCSYTSILTE